MTNTRETAAPLLRPDQIADLLILPTLAASVAAQAASVVHIGSSSLRIPRVKQDPSAAWVSEGEEIPASDAVLDEIEVTPKKLAGLTIISSELAADSSPEATRSIGAGLVRDLARKLDAAFLGTNAGNANQATGLQDVAGVTEIATTATGDYVAPELLVQAISATEQQGTTITAWIAHPNDVAELSTIRTVIGTNFPPIVGIGDTAPGQRSIYGIRLLSSPHVTAGTIWGIPGDRVNLVVRKNAEVTTDKSAFFTSDRVAVRAIMRAEFAYPHPEAITKITLP